VIVIIKAKSIVLFEFDHNWERYPLIQATLNSNRNNQHQIKIISSATDHLQKKINQIETLEVCQL
jgi:hypothetical protein